MRLCWDMAQGSVSGGKLSVVESECEEVNGRGGVGWSGLAVGCLCGGIKSILWAPNVPISIVKQVLRADVENDFISY